MRVEILNTGTELLLGSTINSLAAWLGSELFMLGLRVSQQTTVPDGDTIHKAIGEALARADILIVTGGLGPTSDDITREMAARALNLELISDPDALAAIEDYFAARNRPMATANARQALAPMGAEILPNHHGTAPGIYIPPFTNPEVPCAVFLLPGPPRELQPMFHDQVRPRLIKLAREIIPQSMLELKFTGIGESDFHAVVDAELAAIPQLEFGYCARIGEVDLRLIGTADVVAKAKSIALNTFNAFLVSDDGADLETTIVRLLVAKGKTLATAESCTGGLIANRITNVPGASAAFTHGFVTYANQAKISMLGVSEYDLETHGAVSETVARRMAEGALHAAGSDIAVAVTGIAGPEGGSTEKPVGTAWIALAARNTETTSMRVFQPRNRLDFKLAVSQAALAMVKSHLAAT